MADRIVVLKDGEVQQVADPQTMYERPENIFVAGFIGSPAMNLLRARLQRDTDSPSGYMVLFGEKNRQTHIPLSKEAASSNPELGEYIDHEVILGVRPEHMEHASLTSQEIGPSARSVLEVDPEVIESMGSEKYVYFSPAGARVAHSEALGEATGRVGPENGDGGPNGEVGGDLLVARVSVESPVHKNESMRLAIEADKIRLFDPQTERALI